MKTTKEKIAVMQAFEDGKAIEVKIDTIRGFLHISNPAFNWEKADYRIKPETLEEAIDFKILSDSVSYQLAFRDGAEFGAKWQKEQSEGVEFKGYSIRGDS